MGGMCSSCLTCNEFIELTRLLENEVFEENSGTPQFEHQSLLAGKNLTEFSSLSYIGHLSPDDK